jgi:uncharacterized protein YjbI with pentapeptide repeats
MTYREIDQDKFHVILRLHKKFLLGKKKGKKANFQKVNLEGNNLENFDLRGADLRGAQFDQMIPHNCSIVGSKWLRSDIPWWVGHPQQNEIVLCEE